MTTIRSVILRNGYIYHVFNRGVDRRPIFFTSKDHKRFISLLKYYRFQNIHKSYSHYVKLSLAERNNFLQKLEKNQKSIDILAYCLMPNHFHILVKQNSENGISRYISNVSNGYTKYINTKRNRVGPLYQGPFKAVLIETEEQLIHVSRYIHLNPVVSSIITSIGLYTYFWSSFPAYLGQTQNSFISVQQILGYFKNIKSYEEFVFDQINYAKELERIKHLLIE